MVTADLLRGDKNTPEAAGESWREASVGCPRRLSSHHGLAFSLRRGKEGGGTMERAQTLL